MLLILSSQYSAFQFSASVAIAPLIQSTLQRSSAPSADVLFDQLEAKRHVVDEHRKSITDFYDSLLPSVSSHLCTDLFCCLVNLALLAG